MAAFEVIALDTATPQLRAPGAGDTYTHPRQSLFLAGTAAAPGIAGNSDDNTGMLWPAADTLAWATGGSERMRLDSSGNLGLGVTPSAWGSGYKAFQVSTHAVLTQGSSDTYLGNNWLNDGTNKYLNNGYASIYGQASGQHRWFTAPSGTAGNAISFTQAMTLDASGNLVVGGTTAIGRGTFVNTSAGDGVIIRSNGFDTNKSGANNALLLGLDYTTGVGYIVAGGNTTNTSLSFFTASVAAPVERARIPAAGGMVVGTAALATNATDGFLYVPTCAGTPTGTPTTQTGTAPIVVDTTNNKLYFYSGGQWRDAGP